MTTNHLWLFSLTEEREYFSDIPLSQKRENIISQNRLNTIESKMWVGFFKERTRCLKYANSFVLFFFLTVKNPSGFMFFCILVAYVETSPPFTLISKYLICSLKPRCLQHSVFDNLLHKGT